jgi:hypothetical protein
VQSRAILHFAGKLTASCIDVVTPRLAHGRHDRRVHQDVRKRFHALGRRTAQARSRKWIERNQVQFAGNVLHQLHQLARVSIGVVHAREHDVLERDEVAWCMPQVALAGGQQLAQRILAVERHEFVTQCVVRCVQ